MSIGAKRRKSKQDQSEQLRRDIDRFLEGGGQVTESSGGKVDYSKNHSWKDLSGTGLGFHLKKEDERNEL